MGEIPLVVTCKSVIIGNPRQSPLSCCSLMNHNASVRKKDNIFIYKKKVSSKPGQKPHHVSRSKSEDLDWYFNNSVH